MASRRSLGGGTPGTPWDISINGCVGVGWYLSPHALMRGMLLGDGEMASRKQKQETHGGSAVLMMFWDAFMGTTDESSREWNEVIGWRTNPGWITFANGHVSSFALTSLPLVIISNGVQFASPSVPLV